MKASVFLSCLSLLLSISLSFAQVPIAVSREIVASPGGDGLGALLMLGALGVVIYLILKGILTPQECPEHTFEFEEQNTRFCYYIPEGVEGDRDALRNLCGKIHTNGRLGRIPSAQAQQFIESTFANQTEEFFIDLNDEAITNEFVTSDGMLQEYENFEDDQPNDSGQRQNCVKVIPEDADQFTWQDKPCEEHGEVLCAVEIPI